jgi:hypothetical protein
VPWSDSAGRSGIRLRHGGHCGRHTHLLLTAAVELEANRRAGDQFAAKGAGWDGWWVGGRRGWWRAEWA